jgi:hypothetical protein
LHNPIQKVSLLYYEGFASFRRPRCWLPLLVLWALQAALLMLAVAAAEHAAGGGLMAWLARGLDPELGEYPRFYLELPDLQRRLYLILGATAGVWLQGVCLLQLLERHTRDRVRRERPWWRALARWPGLFVINLVVLALTLGPLLLVQRLLPLLSAGGAARAAMWLSYGLGLLVETFFLYAAFLYVAFASGVVRAVATSVRYALRHIWVSLTLVLVPFFLVQPLRALLALRVGMVRLFRPELILYSLLFVSLVTLAILFLQLSTLVRFYVEEELRQPLTEDWEPARAGEVA